MKLNSLKPQAAFLGRSGRDFLPQPIQPVIRSRDGGCGDASRIFFLGLRQAIPGTIGVVFRRTVLIGGFGAAIENVGGSTFQQTGEEIVLLQITGAIRLVESIQDCRSSSRSQKRIA